MEAHQQEQDEFIHFVLATMDATLNEDGDIVCTKCGHLSENCSCEWEEENSNE